MKKIAILGFGREGQALLTYLKKSKDYIGSEITVLDQNQKIKIPKGVKNILGVNYLKNLNDFEIVFRAPGIPYELPAIQAAIKKGVIFSSATKLFLEHKKGLVIGVTGTKGKGTTCTLLCNILKAAKHKVFLAGNIGLPAVSILSKLKDNSITILELSSFQLHDLKTSPEISVVLNIFPDHLDSHNNFEEYFMAKSSISKYQKSNSLIFYDSNNTFATQIANLSPAKKVGVSTQSFTLFSQKDLLIPGEHNFKNAVMAATIACHLNVPNALILKIVKKFKGLPHRLELIKTFHKIKFYNDSASTNPGTTIAAIKSFQEPIILIMGGKDKLVSFEPLIEVIKSAENLKMIILIGENKDKILAVLNEARVANPKIKIGKSKDLRQAIQVAYNFATTLTAIPYTLYPIILLSPASASFDMFKDYADRGNKFKKYVHGITKK